MLRLMPVRSRHLTKLIAGLHATVGLIDRCLVGHYPDRRDPWKLEMERFRLRILGIDEHEPLCHRRDKLVAAIAELEDSDSTRHRHKTRAKPTGI